MDNTNDSTNFIKSAILTPQPLHYSHVWYVGLSCAVNKRILFWKIWTYVNVFYFAYAHNILKLSLLLDFQCLQEPLVPRQQRRLSRRVVLCGNLRRILRLTTDSSTGGQRCQTARQPAWSHKPAWQLTLVLEAVCITITSATWQQLIPRPVSHTSFSTEVVHKQLHQAQTVC